MADFNWEDFLKEELSKDYMVRTINKVKEDSEKYNIFPPEDMVFASYNITPFDKVKVVILGQDPYHGKGQAMGLSFSVQEGVKIPPSLRNIYKEIEDDLGIQEPNSGDLTRWARQGVFLLNATLTVREGQPNSHKGLWWKTLTDRTIKALNDDNRPKVFMLWGAFAKKKKYLLDNSNHLVLEAAHPSPLSANKGFFGCRHFSQANQFLIEKGLEPIEW